jgi:hypothetical protein
MDSRHAELTISEIGRPANIKQLQLITKLLLKSFAFANFFAVHSVQSLREKYAGAKIFHGMFFLTSSDGDIVLVKKIFQTIITVLKECTCKEGYAQKPYNSVPFCIG